MKQVFNLEYRVLDKVGRTKQTFHAGVFSTAELVEAAKQKILNEHKDNKVAFDVYVNLYTTLL